MAPISSERVDITPAQPQPAKSPSIFSSNAHHIASVLLLLATLLAWEFAPAYLGIPEYVLPPLSSVVRIFTDPEVFRLYGYNSGVTLIEALFGLFIGAFSGFLLGIVLAEIPRALHVIYPYIISIQAIPKVAVAPLFVVWLGFGISSKVLIVALLSFFPVFVNTISGVRSVDDDSNELFRTIGASRLQTLYKLSIPTAMPSIFSGFEIAVSVSMIGAIVGEFVGAQAGLGVLILQAQFRLNIPGVFSILIVLAVIGISLNFLVRFLRRRTLFWMPREQTIITRSTD
jgi:NitT/TauT family transport system permease protein